MLLSGIQVAQGQERFINPIGGYTEDQSTNKLEYITGQNVNGRKRAMDAVIYGLYAVSTGNSIGAGSTSRVIVKVAHGARKNDIIQFTSGLAAGVAIQILSCPTADIMILAATSEFTLAIGDTFDIKRYVTPKYNSDGSLSVVTTSQTQTATFVEDATVSTGMETFTAPAGAFAALVETTDTNTVNIRVVMGGNASSTSGIQFQPGRSEMYNGGSDITYAAESGSGQKISVQWFIRT